MPIQTVKFHRHTDMIIAYKYPYSCCSDCTIFPRIVPMATINFITQKSVDTIQIHDTKEIKNNGFEPGTSFGRCITEPTMPFETLF